MYVDDSGTPSLKDVVEYYVISGVITRDSDLFCIQKKLEEYRKKYFVGRYSYEEIHVHDIYHSRGNFEMLSRPEKYNLLNHLYQLIHELPITIISVGINKLRIQHVYPEWNIFTAAWTFLTERFDSFISDARPEEMGEIVVDTSSNMDETKVRKIVRGLIEHGSYYQNIKNIHDEPSFFPSEMIHGIQIADAASYCTLKYLKGCRKFNNYWNLIMDKMRKSPASDINGYGYKIFP
jgi:hypothetical protein